MKLPATRARSWNQNRKKKGEEGEWTSAYLQSSHGRQRIEYTNRQYCQLVVIQLPVNAVQPLSDDIDRWVVFIAV